MLGHAAAYQLSKKCSICNKWLVNGACKNKCLELAAAADGDDAAGATAAALADGTAPPLQLAPTTAASRVAASSSSSSLRTKSRSPRLHRLQKSPRHASPRLARGVKSPRQARGAKSPRRSKAGATGASVLSPRSDDGAKTTAEPATAASSSVLSPRSKTGSKSTGSSSTSSSSSSARHRRRGGGGNLIAKRAAAFLNAGGSGDGAGAGGAIDYSKASPPAPIQLPTEEPDPDAVAAAVAAKKKADEAAAAAVVKLKAEQKEEQEAAAAAKEEAEKKKKADDKASAKEPAATKKAAADPAPKKEEPKKAAAASAPLIPAGACGVCLEQLGAGTIKVIGSIKARKKFHAKCFKCGDCNYDFMFPADATYGADGKLHCKSCLKKADRAAVVAAKVAAVGSTGKSLTPGVPLPAGSCPLCKKMTDDDDAMLIDKKPYHESCVRSEKCTKCRAAHKRTDPVKLLNMGKGQLPLCVNCFKKIGRAMAFSGTLFKLNPGVDINE